MNQNKPAHLLIPKTSAGLIAFALIVLFTVYEFLLQISPGFMVKPLMQDFHIQAADVGLLGFAYFVAVFCMQPVVGMLIDRYHFRKLISAAILLCALSTFLFAHSHTFFLAFSARLLTGLTAGFAFVSSVYVIKQYF